MAESIPYFHIILPIIIFFTRMLDTSLGTLRLVLIGRGNRKAVRVIGFFEVLLWITAISQLIQHVNHWSSYIAWALGFTAGSFIGFKIEEKMALGKHQMRIITPQPIEEFLEALKSLNQGYTVFDGIGANGPVKQIFIIVNRKHSKEITELMRKHIPQSFCSISDIQATDSGVFNSRKREFALSGLLLPLRQGK
jgi:uncharacterized protein YebE (UPF0316 family)